MHCPRTLEYVAHDNSADKVAMLLSTDWFQSYWHTIGLNATPESRSCIQHGCQGIVDQMMGDTKEYWLISFAESRVRATREAVLLLAHRCGLDTASAERLSELCRERPEHNEREKTAWLLLTVIKELLADDGLTSEIKLALEQADTTFQSDEDFEVVCGNSKSLWDQRIRDLTPDLPMLLSDWVSVGIMAEAALNYILTCLSTEQQRQLRIRFKAAAMKVTGLQEAELPDKW